ncbi:helix-turn-helix domain-containing protein [Dinghuibacter silviterrae]|uniref:AraC-like DNA-binding protein n=1 Tax=Dinghuibacter silviterrae TaxID=1539049 RepID=A0A4R8DTK1_9BACT|nr:helix-turn-helix domain-containing protein [Dinghuibacter silviterrae]TDX01248.1 AraC-like DNA-binding protein [Dinghuibacter silviterrae]
MTDIPRYQLEEYRPLHRAGNDHIPYPIPGLELYSSKGLTPPPMVPARCAFYRVSLVLVGEVEIQIGLDIHQHRAPSVCFTYPNQVFFKRGFSEGTQGYYILFTENFLDELVPSVRMPSEFPFFNPDGHPLFQLEDVDVFTGHILRIQQEMQEDRPGRVKAAQMHLYLLLLEAKRSYERQQLGVSPVVGDLVARFRRLVGQHYREKRQVADYASLLAVTPNHLGRVVREATGRTPSDLIRDLLLLEAKSLLRLTGQSVSEIAYQLEFSDPATFGRFFRKETGMTPLDYREMQD